VDIIETRKPHGLAKYHHPSGFVSKATWIDGAPFGTSRTDGNRWILWPGVTALLWNSCSGGEGISKSKRIWLLLGIETPILWHRKNYGRRYGQEFG
jgi:hypothetical protein